MSRKIILELDTELNEKVEKYQKNYERLTGEKLTKPEAVSEILKGNAIKVY